ncbi:MAG: helix-turn-helix transcriptional regulator [Roseburia sp.]|nr:helix-turn-helix transcriptional regulator [Roseburia sp.]
MIYDKIKEVCKAKGLSVTQVEKQANLSTGAISKWNESSPTVENLKAVADVLGTTVDELLVP